MSIRLGLDGCFRFFRATLGDYFLSKGWKGTSLWIRNAFALVARNLCRPTCRWDYARNVSSRPASTPALNRATKARALFLRRSSKSLHCRAPRADCRILGIRPSGSDSNSSLVRPSCWEFATGCEGESNVLTKEHPNKKSTDAATFRTLSDNPCQTAPLK